MTSCVSTVSAAIQLGKEIQHFLAVGPIQRPGRLTGKQQDGFADITLAVVKDCCRRTTLGKRLAECFALQQNFFPAASSHLYIY